jgi:peptidoglycan/xylan/chitin deacetylase (PgdA/CDA1 family)
MWSNAKRSGRGFRDARMVLIAVAACAGLAIALTAATWARHWSGLAAVDCRVLVAMYHVVDEPGARGTRYRIPAEEFERHVAEVREEGVAVLGLEELYHVLTRVNRTNEPAVCPLPDGEAVVFTFDDGTLDHLERAQPILDRYGYPGVYFLVTGWFDHPGILSESEVSSLVAMGGQVGSHSHFHENLALTEQGELAAGLGASAAIISRWTAGAPVTLAAPGGRYGPSVQATARDAGMDMLFTSRPCYARPGSETMGICRYEIRGDRRVTPLQALRSPSRVAWKATEYSALNRVERVVGNSLYVRAGRVRAILRGERD